MCFAVPFSFGSPRGTSLNPGCGKCLSCHLLNHSTLKKIVYFWSKLLELQRDIGYSPNDDPISFPPLEGRAVDETLSHDYALQTK
jgi:hypothetical protein